MCGIFAYLQHKPLQKQNITTIINEAFLSQHRGPDNSTVTISDNGIYIFHRLAINDQTNMGNQPLKNNDILLICNGEIYNHKELCKKYNVHCTSKSDCEIIIHLYKKIGIEKTVRELDGVYAFVLFDADKNEHMIARDPYGVRQLFIGLNKNNDICCASELKSISSLSTSAQLFPPGTYSIIKNDKKIVYNHWYEFSTLYIYNKNYCGVNICNNNGECLCTEVEIKNNIETLLTNAVKKRMMSEREIGCFLSGGLDSSIVTALVAKCFDTPKHLHTFSIGMEGSTDLKAAKEVANHIGTTHHEIIVSEHELLSIIPEVIYQIESYDTTTVRASTPMYLLSKWIKENTNISVIFSGEGSDEISGSYMYFHNAPSPDEFQKETVRLLKDLHYFDNLRCDKSTAGHGLEVRVPFLDKEFVEYYIRIHPVLRMPRNKIEKYLLRKSFESYLPKSIVWRTKEAFSDGVSSKKKSWYTIIQNPVEKLIPDWKLHNHNIIHNVPYLKETLYYRQTFEDYFPGKSNIIPYYWLPKWSGENIKDPSARVLDVYE